MTKRSRGRAASIAAEAPTFIEFVLDETGSMASCLHQTIGGFNEFLTEQKAQPGDCALTLTKFYTGRNRTPYTDLDIQIAPKLTTKTFEPGGGTNLYDTIAERVSALHERLAEIDGDVNVLFIVMTDGQDTCSRNNPTDIANMLGRQMERGWTFVFLGAYESSAAVARNMGFPAGNIKSFAKAVMEETMQQTSAATTAYRAARTSGQIAAGTTSVAYFTE